MAQVKHPDKPFCLIVWNDAWGDDAEVAAHEIEHQPARVQSYGWALRSNEIGVTLAAEWGPGDGRYRATTFIPRAMIVEEKELSFRNKRPKADPHELLAK